MRSSARSRRQDNPKREVTPALCPANAWPVTLPPPSYRKVAAAGLIILLIVLWALLIAIFAPYVARWPVLVQALFYLIVGIAWIIPLKPLLRWSEAGSFRSARKADVDGEGGDISKHHG